MKVSRPERAILPCWTLLVLLLGSGSVAAQSQGAVIPAGLDAQFGALLDGVAPMLPSGFEWQSAEVKPERVTVQFGPKGAAPVGCDEANLCLVLVHRALEQPGDLPGGDFSVRIQHVSGAEWEGLSKAVAGRVAEGLQGWSSGKTVQPWVEGQVEEQGALHLLILVLFCLALVSLLTVWVLEWRAVPWRWAAVGLAGAVGTFMLSWLLVPHGIFHDNHHGYTFLTLVEGGGNPKHIIVSSFLALAQWLHHWFGGGDNLLWAVNAGAMALSVPLLGWWIAAASRVRWAGVLAGAMWAISPWALRMGPTDCLFNLSVALLPASALLLGLSMRRFEASRWRGVPALVAAVALAVLAGQTHVPAMFLPPVVLPMALAMGPLTCRRQRVWMTVGVLCVALLLLPAALAIVEVAMKGEGSRFIEAGNLVSLYSWSRRLIWSGTWMAWSVVPLALFALVVLLQRDRRKSLWLAVSWAGLLLGMLTIATCEHLHVAMELPLGCITTGLAGVGAGLLASGLSQLWTGWRGRLAGGSVALLAVVSVVQPWPVLGFQPPGTQEYRFLVDRVLPLVALQPQAKLLVPGSLRLDDYPRMPLPRAWLEARLPDTHVYSFLNEIAGDSAMDSGLVYIGLSCIQPLQGDIEPGEEGESVCQGEGAVEGRCEARSNQPASLSEPCRAEVEGLELVPVITARLRHEPAHFLCVGFPNRSLEVGLYRIVSGSKGGSP